MRRMRRKRREQKIKVANKTVSSSERVRAIRRTASRLSQQPGSACECARVNWRKRIIQFERCLISPLISSSVNLTASSCDARVKFIHSFRSHLLITLWLPIFIIYVYALARSPNESLLHNNYLFLAFPACEEHGEEHKIVDAKNALRNEFYGAENCVARINLAKILDCELREVKNQKM